LDPTELIIRSLRGHLSSEEEAALSKWLDEAPEHRGFYEDMVAVWRATGEFLECGGISLETSPPPKDLLLQIARADRGGQEGRRRIWQVASVAAALVVGLVIGGSSASPTPSNHGDAIGEVMTAAGERTTVRLSDGSIVRLAPDSRLFVPADGGGRRVTLEGRAFFAVSSDEVVPFQVSTHSSEVTALGTRFEVTADEEGVRLVVVEGRVSMTSGERVVELGSRQLTQLREGEEPVILEVPDVWGLAEWDWMGGFLAFKNTPLREVATELDRRFSISLVLEDRSLADETVTAWFRDEPLEQVVSVVCRLIEVQCVMDGSEVRVHRAR
jgi:transmembrane sensor